LSAIPRARAALERFLPAWKPQRVTYRAVGMGMAADVEPAIMMKLPLAFKRMGMSVHRDFNAIADGIEQAETGPQTLQRLSNIMSRCTTCHDMYRLSVK
jgi:hypothetical protein